MTERLCFKGSIDDWIPIGGAGTLLAQLHQFVKYLGREMLPMRQNEQMNKNTKSQSSEEVPMSKPTSKWFVESHDGRFVIDHVSDGSLMIVDRAQMNPNDEEDMQGFFSVLPEDRIEFMQVMRAAVATEALENAELCQNDKCPHIVIVKKPK